jgi:hypothetical protein
MTSWTEPHSKLNLAEGIKCSSVAHFGVSVSENGSVETYNSNLFVTTIGLKLMPDGRLEFIIADDSSTKPVLPFHLSVKMADQAAIAVYTQEAHTLSLVIDLRKGSVFCTSAGSGWGSVTLLHCIKGSVPKDDV